MKSTLQAAAALLVLAQLACQTVTPPTVAPPQTESYANADKALAFDYPADWVVIDKEENADILLVSAANLADANPADFVAGEARLNLWAFVFPSDRDDADADTLELLESLTAEDGNAGEREFLEGPALKVLGSQEFGVAVMQVTNDYTHNKPAVYFIGVWKSGGLTLSAFGETSPEGVAAFQPIFEAVLASLVVSRPTCADETEGCF